MTVLGLHDDITRTLAALLAYEDLEALTSVSTTSRRSLFREIRDGRAAILVLPPTDHDRARSLLGNLDSAQLTRFQWIQIAAPWHIDLLVECGLEALVLSVRVAEGGRLSFRARRSSSDDTVVIAKICEKLPLLTSLSKLSVSGTGLTDVTPLSRMLQLRELDLSYTQVVDVSSLSALVKLESLVIQHADVYNLSCIHSMSELRLIKVAAEMMSRPEIGIPSLVHLTKLRTLDLMWCKLQSVGDLVLLSMTLDRLTLRLVSTETRDVKFPDQNVSEFTHNLLQLETISQRGRRFTFDEPASTLSRVSDLHVTSHTISKYISLRELARLEFLEDLCLDFPSRARESGSYDLSVLLRLPRLTRLEITLETRVGWENQIPPFGESPVYAPLSDVLPQLTQVKHLVLRGRPEHTAMLAPLSHLESLKLGFGVTTFDWIRSFRSLRSLTIKAPSRGCDLGGIGDLIGLEVLQLDARAWECDDATPLSFLSHLENLKTLHLDVSHLHDLAVLSGLRSLVRLTISSSCTRVPAKNVDTLSQLTQLRELDISATSITDTSQLADLPRLRTVWLSSKADCTPLQQYDHPKLLRIWHPHRNCLWAVEERATQSAQDVAFTNTRTLVDGALCNVVNKDLLAFVLFSQPARSLKPRLL